MVSGLCPPDSMPVQLGPALQPPGTEVALRSQGATIIRISALKSVRGFDGFYGRGLATAKSEWNLICGTNNLLKLFIWMRTLRN